MKKMILVLAFICIAGICRAEEPKLKFTEHKYYRVYITPEATLEDIKWLFNDTVYMRTKDKEVFKGREKAFKLTE